MALSDDERSLLDSLLGQTITAVEFHTGKESEWDATVDVLTLTLANGSKVELVTWDTETYASGFHVGPGSP